VLCYYGRTNAFFIGESTNVFFYWGSGVVDRNMCTDALFLYSVHHETT
jgi:hypothetical protein